MEHFATTRQDAIRRGEKFYLTGNPCVHGHRSPRTVRKSECLVCKRAGKLANKRRHPEVNRARVKRYRDKDPVTYLARQRAAWHDPANKNKNRARTAVKIAKRNGTLVPLPCKCGALDVEAHHPDYSKPLEVVWLCPRCHAATHSR